MPRSAETTETRAAAAAASAPRPRTRLPKGVLGINRFTGGYVLKPAVEPVRWTPEEIRTMVRAARAGDKERP